MLISQPPGGDGAGDAEAAAAAVEEEKVEGVEEEEGMEAPDNGEVMAIMVHRTDKLKNDFKILHPVVRVHVVDEATGLYLPKQHKSVLFRYFYFFPVCLKKNVIQLCH